MAKKYLPIFIALDDKKILVVGGGQVAWQKIRTLAKFSRTIIVLAPIISRAIAKLKIRLIRAAYCAKYLEGIDLVFACTNDRKLNARIKADANKKKILVNVIDDPSLCDFIMPAIYKKAEMTVAVSSNGQNVRKSVCWRNKIKRLLGQ